MNENNSGSSTLVAFKAPVDRKRQIEELAKREHRSASSLIKSILFPELDRREQEERQAA